MAMEAFHYKDGNFYCENVQIDSLVDSFPKTQDNIKVSENRIIRTEVPATPLYIYSSAALKRNVQNYKGAFESLGLSGILGYAAKANPNTKLIHHLKRLGVEMLITVSGYEILNGLKVGFQPNQIIFNGNGKQAWEIKLAVSEGVLLNVDSLFDARRITQIASSGFPNKKVQVLLRLQPMRTECESIDVHPYVDTSGDSKFGFGTEDLDEMIQILLAPTNPNIEIVGLHCHLGSCIPDPQVISYAGTFLLRVKELLMDRGVRDLKYLNIGGGIGVNYYEEPEGLKDFLDQYKDQIRNSKHNAELVIPSPKEFLKTVANLIPPGPGGIRIIIEPGRSLVANAGVIITNVLGTKTSPFKKYFVVDAGMTELIRPSLYGSHHHIFPTKLESNSKWECYDVVGPVCESGDFLGKNIPVQSPPPRYMTIMNCGAYASSMSSNYNMRPKPAEILVEGSKWSFIRKRQNFNDVVQETETIDQA